MKVLTIRMRMTIWYAFFMLVLVLLSLAIISNLSAKAQLTNQKENLIEMVTDGIGEIDSPGDFDYFHYGVYLLLYDENETYINGIVPEGFAVSQPLHNDFLQTVVTDDLEFYVYDKYINSGDNAYWLRGVTPHSEPDIMGKFTVTLVSGVLPVFVLITCIIGYFITGRAFRPVKKIQETAQNIANSDELSLRIGLPEGKDEIAKLGKTIDHMLDKLQRSFEKEKQFTSDASHELRTPLAVILTESEYALRHAESIDEMKESMEVVNRQANRMSALINQLLFLSRADHDSFKINNETFEVLPVASELVQDYQLIAENTDITISIIDSLPTNLSITFDKTLFARCLSNIIQNAISYSNPGGHIELKVSQEENYLAVAITDDGIGINSDNLEKIWDRFYQVEESRSKDKGNSMGLGLAMVKAIVEKQGGYIAATSTLGKGSTFILYFSLH